MSNSNEDGSGCVGVFLVIVFIGGAIIEWIGNSIKGVWTTITNFFSSLGDLTPYILPVIGVIIIIVAFLVAVFTIVEIVSVYRHNKKIAQDRQEWINSEKGQNEIQQQQVEHKLERVNSIKKALIEKRQKHTNFIQDMTDDLSLHPSRDSDRFKNHISIAKRIVDDIDKEAKLCDGYISELTKCQNDLRREAKSLQHFGSMKDFSENLDYRIETLKEIERFLGSYYITTDQGGESLILSQFDYDRLEYLKEEREIRS